MTAGVLVAVRVITAVSPRTAVTRLKWQYTAQDFLRSLGELLNRGRSAFLRLLGLVVVGVLQRNMLLEG